MAKKTYEEVDLNEVQNEDMNVPVVEAEVTSVTAATKKVTIHTVEDIDSIIASVPYKFSKDKDVTVPSDVAAILCFSRKAYRR